jgi:hypothetical protein
MRPIQLFFEWRHTMAVVGTLFSRLLSDRLLILVILQVVLAKA